MPLDLEDQRPYTTEKLLMPSTLETIDAAMVNFINEGLNSIDDSDWVFEVLKTSKISFIERYNESPN